MLETGVKFSGTEDLWTRVVSVAEAGAFKPHFNTYAIGAKAVNPAPSEVLFVANHAFDCVGAKAAGMHTAFVDRRKRPFGNEYYRRRWSSTTSPTSPAKSSGASRTEGSRDVPEAMLRGAWAWSERGRSVRDGVGEPRRDLRTPRASVHPGGARSPTSCGPAQRRRSTSMPVVTQLGIQAFPKINNGLV